MVHPIFPSQFGFPWPSFPWLRVDISQVSTGANRWNPRNASPPVRARPKAYLWPFGALKPDWISLCGLIYPTNPPPKGLRLGNPTALSKSNQALWTVPSDGMITLIAPIRDVVWESCISGCHEAP